MTGLAARDGVLGHLRPAVGAARSRRQASPWVQSQFGLDVLAEAQELILDTAAKVLTPEVVEDFVEPLVAQMFHVRVDRPVACVSFVIALWSGSRLVATAVQAVVSCSGDKYAGYVPYPGSARSLMYTCVARSSLHPCHRSSCSPGRISSRTCLGTSGTWFFWIGFLGATTHPVRRRSYHFSLVPRRPLRRAPAGRRSSPLRDGFSGRSASASTSPTASPAGRSTASSVHPIAIMLWAYVDVVRRAPGRPGEPRPRRVAGDVELPDVRAEPAAPATAGRRARCPRGG